MSDIEAVIARLVDQFASPYDFVRELVQNALDARADRVDVTLVTHALASSGGDEVVFELVVADTGVGMDERVIDEELTRLYASGKTGDRTQVGGFGIGFVSVFAWDPEAVLIHTGHGGRAFELHFFADKTYAKHAMEQPFEGTTVRLFRHGVAGQRREVAEAIRDALWRYCRYCPIELTFEDLADEQGPELVQDAPDPEQETWTTTIEGEHENIRIALGVPPHVVLLRGGLILAEGPPQLVLGDDVEGLQASFGHLRVHADSWRLHTSIARDGVVHDAGFLWLRAELERGVQTLVRQMTGKIETLAAAPTLSAREWADYAGLQRHLMLESSRIDDLDVLPLFRDPVGTRARSLDDLRRHARYGIVLIAPAADVARSVAPPKWNEASAGGLPLVEGTWPEDASWLAPALARVGLVPHAVEDVLVEVHTSAATADPTEGASPAWFMLCRQVLADCDVADVRLGTLSSGALVAVGSQALAFRNANRIPDLQRLTVWIGVEHPLVRHVDAVAAAHPYLAALALALTVSCELGLQASDVGRRAASIGQGNT